MILWVSDNKTKNSKIDIMNLHRVMTIISKSKNKYRTYLMKIYREYKDFFSKNKNPNCILHNLEITLDNIVECNQKYKLINDSSLVLSDSHKQTYFVIKELNQNKLKHLAIICFDMHSDTYAYSDELWKGNVFSKLINEQYIEYPIIV